MTEIEKLEYIKQNYPVKRLKQIASDLGWLSPDPVRKRLRELGISLQRRGAARTERESQITQEQHEIIEGWLLSDGGLELSNTSVTPFFRLSLTQPLAIEYTKNILPFSFAKTWIRYAHTVKWAKKDVYVVRSHSDRALSSYQKRWYPNGKKIIPFDFIPTPRTMRFAIYGDGTLQINKGTYALTLCLEAFTHDDKLRLISSLNQFGFAFKLNKRGRPFICGKDQLHAFLRWVGPPELECFAYKFDWRDEKNEIQEVTDYIKLLSNPNVSNKYIAHELNKTGFRWNGKFFSRWVIGKIRSTNGFPCSNVKSGNDPTAMTFKPYHSSIQGVSKIQKL